MSKIKRKSRKLIRRTGFRRRFKKTVKKTSIPVISKQFKKKVLNSGEILIYTPTAGTWSTTLGSSQIRGYTDGSNYPKITLYNAMENFRTNYGGGSNTYIFVRYITLKVGIYNNYVTNRYTTGELVRHNIMAKTKDYALSAVSLNSCLNPINQSVGIYTYSDYNPKVANYNYARKFLGKFKSKRFNMNDSYDPAAALNNNAAPTTTWFTLRIKINRMFNIELNTSTQMRDRAIYVSSLNNCAVGSDGQAMTLTSFDVCYAEKT